MNIKEKVISLTDAINDHFGTEFGNLTDAVQYALNHGGADIVKMFYPHYVGNISEFDGLYNSHSYDAVFLKGQYLYVFYTSAPHHFTDKKLDTTALMMCKYDVYTRTSVEYKEILRPARCFWHGFNVGNDYYLIAESGTKYLLKTSDFVNFEESTWSAPSDFTNMNYICVADTNRLVCSTGQTSRGMNIYYSDDLGKTWSKSSGYADAVTTHGAFAYIGNGKIVYYCQGRYDTSDLATHSIVRYVLVSEDNGLTWTGSECIDADLRDCGPSYSSGGFCKIDNTWYFATHRRTCELKDDGFFHYGDVRLFKGSEDDLRNGTMALCKVIDDFNTFAAAPTVGMTTFQSDSGNMTMVSNGSQMFIVYHKQILPREGKALTESNSMTCLSIVDNDKPDTYILPDWYDELWMDSRDAIVDEKDTEHSLYAYGSETNMKDIVTSNDYATIKSDQCVVLDTLSVPYNSKFRVVAVVYYTNRYIDGEFQEQFIKVGIGDKTIYFGGTINNFYLNRQNGTNYACSLSVGFGYNYFVLSYDNGVVSASLNGRTIDNLKSSDYYNTGTNGKIEISLGLNKGYLEEQTKPNDIVGFKALAIDTDADVSDLIRQEVPDEPTDDRLPSGYTIKEYLESDGNQYIDTEYVFKTKPKLVAEIYIPRHATLTDQEIFGFAETTAPRFRADFYQGNLNFYMTYGTTSKQVDTRSPNGSGNSYFYDEFVYCEIDNIFRFKGKETVLATVWDFSTNTQTLRLFAGRTFKPCAFKETKLYDDDVLVRDLIPCLDTSGIPCMYDAVEHKTYYNSGTGTFAFG